MKIKILLCLFLCLGCASESQMDIRTIEPGATAPTFNLKNIDGKMISPDNYPDAKGFIIVFTANTCPYAVAYEDRLIELDKKFAPQGYPVIAINPNKPSLSSGDSFENMQKKVKAKAFSFPYLFDEGQKVSDQFGARVTPHVFLLKKVGLELNVIYTGAVDNDTENINPEKISYVEKAIAEMEAGKPIENPLIKAIGCTVKREILDLIP